MEGWGRIHSPLKCVKSDLNYVIYLCSASKISLLLALATTTNPQSNRTTEHCTAQPVLLTINVNGKSVPISTLFVSNSKLIKEYEEHIFFTVNWFTHRIIFMFCYQETNSNLRLLSFSLVWGCFLFVMRPPVVVMKIGGRNSSNIRLLKCRLSICSLFDRFCFCKEYTPLLDAPLHNFPNL